MRINKFISTNSEYSRRKADELIGKGQVSINGEKASLGSNVDPEKDEVKILGQPINLKKEKIYLVLNKPHGYISSRHDDHGRRTVMDLVPAIDNLKPVGRLDYDTEGLILFSNDGEFINKQTHPRYEAEKEYFTIIKGLITDAEKEKIERGVLIEGKKTSPAKVEIMERNSTESTVKITIHEGRNRQVKKMFQYIHHPVKYLKRVRIGKIELKGLEKGKFRYLTSSEINAD